MLVAMNVIGLTLDKRTQSPVLILKENGGERFLPIWIGVLEASAVAMAVEEVSLSRPLTHDLFKNMLSGLESGIDHAAVIDLFENTYYAEITVNSDGKRVSIDARPSDAIALALRFKAPIYCKEHVLQEAHIEMTDLEQSKPEPKYDDEIGSILPIIQEAISDKNKSPGENEFHFRTKTKQQPFNFPDTLVQTDPQVMSELLETLDQAAFGKYKM